jgi:hypothetical protein
VGANSLFFNVTETATTLLAKAHLFNNIHASANTVIGDVALGNNDLSGLGTARLALNNITAGVREH